MKDPQHNPGYRWFVSTGFTLMLLQNCGGTGLVPRDFLRFNQWWLLLTVMACTLIVRIIGKSWILAMIVASVLLSRGHLVGNVGEVGYQNFLMLIVAIWFLNCVAFFRSGSRTSFVLSCFFGLVAVLFDPALIFLPLSLPVVLMVGYLLRKYLVRPILQRFREDKKTRLQNIRGGRIRLYEGGVLTGAMLSVVNWIIDRPAEKQSTPGLARPVGGRFWGGLGEPFALWIFQHRRWLTVLRFGFAATAMGVLFILIQYWSLLKELNYTLGDLADATNLAWGEGWLHVWSNGLIEPVDLHLGASVFIFALCAVQSPARGLANCFESVWLIAFAILGCVLCAAFADIIDLGILHKVEGQVGSWSFLAWGRAPKVLVWFEPILLSFGILGLYHLIQVGGHR